MTGPFNHALCRVPTASYKSYNLTHCPIFVLYLGEEGICPIFYLKMSHESYNLGVLSYNHFQTHVHIHFVLPVSGVAAYLMPCRRLHPKNLTSLIILYFFRRKSGY